MGPRSTTADRRIAALAARAHGNVTRGELLDAEVTTKQIRGRVERGSLLPVFPGVYRVGHMATSIEATYMAAVKACGTRSTLSGAAAAHHLGLIKGPPPPPEVTAPTKKHIKGIKTKRGDIH